MVARRVAPAAFTRRTPRSSRARALSGVTLVRGTNRQRARALAHKGRLGAYRGSGPRQDERGEREGGWYHGGETTHTARDRAIITLAGCEAEGATTQRCGVEVD